MPERDQTKPSAVAFDEHVVRSFTVRKLLFRSFYGGPPPVASPTIYIHKPSVVLVCSLRRVARVNVASRNRIEIYYITRVSIAVIDPTGNRRAGPYNITRVCVDAA